MDVGLNLSVNGDGSVNAPSLQSNSYYDSVEFTINDPNQQYRNLNINLTSVDQWGVPLQFKIESTDTIDNPDHPNGTPTATTRALVVSNFQTFTQNSIFKASLDTDSGANGPYRILNPSHILGDSETGIQPIWVSTVLQQKILTNTQTQINVASASAFPNPANGAFTIQVENEQMSVTGASPPLADGTTNWTVTRGVNGTNAVPHLVLGTAVTQLNPVITATQTTLPVGGSDGFPTPSAASPFTIVVDSEIMLVTGIAGYNSSRPIYTVQRGYDGTVATTHNEGALVYYYSAVTSPFNSYYNSAIDALFTKYHNTGDTLTLQSNGSGSEVLYDGHVTTDANGVYVFQFWQQGDPTGFKFDVYYPFFENNHYFWAGYTPGVAGGPGPVLVGAGQCRYGVAVVDGVQLQRRVRGQCGPLELFVDPADGRRGPRESDGFSAQPRRRSATRLFCQRNELLVGYFAVLRQRQPQPGHAAGVERVRAVPAPE